MVSLPSEQVFQPSRAMNHPLGHHAFVIGSEEDEVATVNCLSQTLDEVIPSPKRALSFLDARANREQLIDE